MLISANIGRVSWEKPNSVYKPKRFLGVRPFGDYLLRGRGANIEITFHLVRNPEIKIGEVDHGGGSFLLIGGIFCVNLILSDAAEIVDVRSNIFLRLFVLQYSCIRSVPGISVRMLDILFIFSVSLKYSHWTQ
jgi:hypothetical protein